MHAERAVERLTVVVGVLPRLGTRSDDAVGDHLGRLLKGQILPLGAARAVGPGPRFSVDHE